MVVIFYLVALLAVCWAYGFAVVVVLQRLLPFSLFQIRAVRFTVPVIGYAVANVIWWRTAIIMELSNSVAFLILSSFVIVAAVLLIKYKFSRRLIVPLLPARCDGPALIVLLVVAAFATWPTIAAGMDNYFLFNDSDWFNRVIPAILNHHDAADIARASQGSDFAKDAFHLEPLQVSSLMLLQLVLGRSSNDVALLQTFVNLVFTGLGTYWLARYFFRQGSAPAVLVGILGVIAQMYFHTYLDGHIGSTMYSSTAPFFFGVGIRALVRNRYRSTIIVLAILWYYLGLAYSLVANLLLLPLIVAKLLQIYIGNENRVVSGLNARLRARLSAVGLRTTLVVIAALAAGPIYLGIRAVFYDNRVALYLMGYIPMLIVVNPQVLEWFYGLRLTLGFGYGFVPSAIDLHAYDAFATAVAVILTVVVAIGAWRLFRSGRERFFLATFLILFPLVPLVFTSVLPFTYVTYKMLEVHYFLIVIGALCGFQYLLAWCVRRRVWPAVLGLWCVIAYAVGVNVVGTVMNSRVSLQRVLPFDMADLATLAKKIKAADLKHVTAHVDSGNLALGVIWYQLASAGVDFTYLGFHRGQPSITPQEYVFNKIPAKDVVMSSDKGKYVLTYTPESLLGVHASLSPERGNGVLFLWLSNELEYNTLKLEPDIRSLAAYLNSLPGSPVVYNDLSDSGYYMTVDFLLNEYGIRHSDDPRRCDYFIRLRPRMVKAIAEERDPNASPLVKFLVAPVSDQVGQLKVVDTALVDLGEQSTPWQGELFEAVEIPPAVRRMSTPQGLDISGLVNLLRKRRVSVTNQIPSPEYERYFLDDRLRGAGIVPVDSANAETALVAVPSFLLEQELQDKPEFSRSILWESPDADYRILLVKRVAAEALRARETGPFWAVDKPFRTLLEPIAGSPFVEFLTFRRDGYVKIIIGTGPSLPRLTGTLRAVRLDGLAEPLFFKISNPSQIVMLPIKHFVRPGEPLTDIALDPMPELNNRVMPHDDRLLPYLLLAAELSEPGDPIYSEHMIQVIKKGIIEGGPQGDIVDASAFPALALGAGWYGRESAQPSMFRWISDQADLVFDSGETQHRIITISGQAGVAHVTVVAKLNGVPVFSQHVDYSSGTTDLVLDLNQPEFKHALRPGQNVITLSTIKLPDDEYALAADPRELAFRVFHVGFGDSVGGNRGHRVTSNLARSRELAEVNAQP